MAHTNRLPLVARIEEPHRPLDIMPFLIGRKHPFFLDSAMSDGKLGCYSLLGADPFLTISSRGDQIRSATDAGVTFRAGNPLEELARQLENYRQDPHPFPLPCPGGAVGYFSYDLGRWVEKLPARAKDDLELPEMFLGFYDLMVIYDHALQEAYAVSTGWPEKDEKARRRRAKQRLDDFFHLIQGRRPDGPTHNSWPTAAMPVQPEGNFTPDQYRQAVRRAREYIVTGDIFEVNLSQRFSVDLEVTPWDLYRRLRAINPAPFAAYLDAGEVVAVSSSPERFLRRRGDEVETRPIKGTIRRGSTPEEDLANARWLLASEKNRAENMMIVDLARNDLGRVCRYGTVKVAELAILETYPTVFHLTSTVVGRLRPQVSNMDLLRATFPGGSITGAPKIRAMEIIDELEPTRRSIYTGSIGYLGFDGNLDLNIVIRTILVKDRRACLQVGGAVIYDSCPQAEYEETLVKARALFSALNLTV